MMKLEISTWTVNGGLVRLTSAPVKRPSTKQWMEREFPEIGISRMLHLTWLCCLSKIARHLAWIWRELFQPRYFARNQQEII